MSSLSSSESVRGNTRIPHEDKRYRSWFFTWNNPEQKDQMINLLIDVEKYIFQKERGENGTEHFQGVVYYRNMKSFKQMKGLCNKIHWMP